MPALLETTVRFLTPASRIALDQRLGNAAEAEAARHDQHAVVQQTGQGRVRVGIDLVRHRPNLPLPA